MSLIARDVRWAIERRVQLDVTITFAQREIAK